MAYSTWNPLDKNAILTLSNGDLTYTQTTTGYWYNIRSTVSVSSGKWYWEHSTGFSQAIGIGNSSETLGSGNHADAVGSSVNGWSYWYTGPKYHNASLTAYGSSYSIGDVISVALDMDNGEVYFAKNGVWQNSSDPVTRTNPAFTGISGSIFAMNSSGNRLDNVTSNFGASSFTYTVPSGYNSGLYTSDATVFDFNFEDELGLDDTLTIQMATHNFELSEGLGLNEVFDFENTTKELVFSEELGIDDYFVLQYIPGGTVDNNDVQLCKSLVINDTLTNGGSPNYNTISQTDINNLFPNVTNQDRELGKVRYRKFYLWNYYNTNDELKNIYLCLGKPSDGDNHFVFSWGDDYQGDTTCGDLTFENQGMIYNRDWYGCGILSADATSGDTTALIEVETNLGWTDYSYGVSISDITFENTETLLVDSINWLDDTNAILNLTNPITNNYLSGDYVGNMLFLGNLTGSVSLSSINSSSGTFNDSYLTFENQRGLVFDKWTLTFSDSTNFTCSGEIYGNVGSGNINTFFRPINSNFISGDVYYFIIESYAWGGTFVNGDTVEICSFASMNELWMKHIIPKNTTYTGNDNSIFRILREFP